MSLTTQVILFKMRVLAIRMHVRFFLTETLPTKLYGKVITETQEVGVPVKIVRDGVELIMIPVDRYRYRPRRPKHVLETNGMWICKNPLPDMYAGAIAGKSALEACNNMVELPLIMLKLENITARMQNTVDKIKKEQ